jgi:hypothetical protein
MGLGQTVLSLLKVEKNGLKIAAKSVALLQKISGQAKLIDRCLKVFFQSVVVDGKEMSNSSQPDYQWSPLLRNYRGT